MIFFFFALLTKSLVVFCFLQYAFSQPTSPVNPFPIHTILEGESVDEIPPPLPTRNRSFHSLNSNRVSIGGGPPLPPRCNNLQVPSNNGAASISNQPGGGLGESNVSKNAVSQDFRL